MNERELGESRAKLVADAQALLKENRSAENIAKANKMLDDADGLKSQIDIIERADSAEAETRSAKPFSNPKPGALDSAEARAKAESVAFRNYIVNGKPGENASALRSYNPQTMQIAEYRDMGVSTGAAGGFLVPIGFQTEIEQAKLAYGAMLTVVRDWKTDSGAPIQQPLSNDTANASTEMTDGIDVTESDVPVAQVTFNCSTFSTGVIRVSRSLLQDSAFDLAGFIKQNFAERMMRGLNKAVTLGSTSGNVASIVNGAYVAATSAAPTALVYQDLVNLYSSLDPAYVSTSSWAFNNNVLRSLIGLVDLYNRPLFVASITSGMPDTILGRPYIINQDLATPAATTKSILFGDMSKYVFRTAAGLEVLRLDERYATANQVGFVGFHRHSGKLLDAGTHPVVALQQHA